MARIVVTGAAGFIGSNLVDRLLRRGDDVIGVDSFCPVYDPAIKRANLREALAHPRFVLHEEDVRQQARMVAVLAASTADCVVHLAGRSGAVRSLEDAEDYFASNLETTQRLLEACRITGVGAVVFASTMSLYGPTREPVTESALLPAPANAYVASKRLAEETCRAYADVCSLNVTILRIASVYGPRQRKEMAISTFARAISAGEPVRVWGTGGGRDFVFVDDAVGAILAAVDRNATAGIVNVGGGRFIEVEHLIGVLAGLLGRRARVERVPMPASVPERVLIDISRMTERLGYAPQVSIEDGLRLFLHWFRSQTAEEGRGAC